MCEYCGCQSLVSIDELTREHTAGLELIADARVAALAGDHLGAGLLATELLVLLEPHTAVEEQALFPALAREHPEHVAVLHAEHEQVHRVLADVSSQAAAPGWAEAFVAALQMLREHIFKEQDGLFPAALIELSTPDWERIEAVRARVGSVLALTQR